MYLSQGGRTPSEKAGIEGLIVKTHTGNFFLDAGLGRGGKGTKSPESRRQQWVLIILEFGICGSDPLWIPNRPQEDPQRITQK